jgi:hypothetical protein
MSTTEPLMLGTIRNKFWVAILMLASVLAAAPAHAETELAGVYKYAGGQPEIDKMYMAVEEVVQKMNFMIRGIARKKLRRPNMPSAEVDLKITADTITLARTGQDTVAAPRDGKTITWKNGDGDEFKVKYELNGDSVLQTMVGKSSHSTNRFTLEGDTLKVATRIESQRLPAPVIFEFTYKKK